MTTQHQIVRTAMLLVLGTGLLHGCSNAPKAPDWQLEAKAAIDRSVAAYLEGNTRIEQADLARARGQLARTGRADLVANAELMHCAARAASLVFEPCTGFDALRPDATEAQRAYADYLRGQVTPSRTGLLPAAQQHAAARSSDDATALQNIDDPLALLVAAAVLLQTGKASPAVVAQAVDTASGQGWRRPLLAWLGVQLKIVTQAGKLVEAERIQRRIQLVSRE